MDFGMTNGMQTVVIVGYYLDLQNNTAKKKQSKHGTGEPEELPTNLKSYFILVDVEKNIEDRDVQEIDWSE